LGQLLQLSFGEKGINKNLDQVFVFCIELLHLAELLEQFFIRELGGYHFVLGSLHKKVGSGVQGLGEAVENVCRGVGLTGLIAADLDG